MDEKRKLSNFFKLNAPKKRKQLPIKKGMNCLLPQEGGELSSPPEKRD